MALEQHTMDVIPVQFNQDVVSSIKTEVLHYFQQVADYGNHFWIKTHLIKSPQQKSFP